MIPTKRRTRNIISFVLTIAFIFLMTAAIIPGVNGATTNVDLGLAGNYAVLAKSGITTTGTTSINGDIGVSPISATSITGFGLVKDASNQFSRSSLVRGNVYAADYAPPTPATLTTAVNDMQTAYTTAAGRTVPDGVDLYAGNLGGRTLTPGIYKWSTGVLIPPSTALTLDGKGDSSAVWIFQISGDLTMNSASRIILAGGAQTPNIYWQVAGSTGVIIGSGAHAEGIFLAQKAITMNSGASLSGRALAQTAVTLIANTINAPPATNPQPVVTAQPGVIATYQPGVTATLLPGVTASIQTVATITNPTTQAGTTITVPVTGDSGIYQAVVTGTGINGLALTGSISNGPDPGTGQPPGIVYQYVNLAPAQYTPVDQAVVSYSVPLSWLNDNHITPQNISLSNIQERSWVKLPTTFAGTDGTTAFYTATVPGFGLVAITGQFTSPFPAATQSPGVPVTTAVTISSTETQFAPLATQSPVPFWVPFSAVIGALLITGVLSGRGRKNS